MAVSSNSINNSMNSSSALVAYLRNEIRSSVNAAFSAVVTSYRKNTFILSFMLVLFMTSIYVMGVQIPWYAAIALTLATGYSIFRGFLEIMIGMKDCTRDMQ